jgi:hypothetical protein
MDLGTLISVHLGPEKGMERAKGKRKRHEG